MYYVITQLGTKITFASIDQLFDYVNAHKDVISGFVGVKDGDHITI